MVLRWVDRHAPGTSRGRLWPCRRWCHRSPPQRTRRCSTCHALSLTTAAARATFATRLRSADSCEVVEHRENGFAATSDEEWRQRPVVKLVHERVDRQHAGHCGRAILPVLHEALTCGHADAGQQAPAMPLSSEVRPGAFAAARGTEHGVAFARDCSAAPWTRAAATTSEDPRELRPRPRLAAQAAYEHAVFLDHRGTA